MLGARWRRGERHLDLEVPLPGGRTQLVKAFVVDGAEPFSEGEPLFGVESDVGELTALVDVPRLLAGLGVPGYARVALVRGETDAPRVVVQGFLPFARARDRDLAAAIYQTAAYADGLERSIFGGDAR
jgi:hypothetical protein